MFLLKWDKTLGGSFQVTFLPELGNVGLVGGLILASPQASDRIKDEEPPGKERLGFGQKDSEKEA